MLSECPEDWEWNNGIGFLPINGKESKPVPYDESYFNKYVGYSKTEQGRIITDLRTELVSRWFSYLGQNPVDLNVLDVGIGCGSFVVAMRRIGFNCWGTDVNPVGIKWLEEQGFLFGPEARAEILTFWDVLEHIERPGELLEKHKPKMIFVSMPIYDEEWAVFRSKHYKPGEHCWYFTREGLRRFMEQFGYRCLEMNLTESEVGGREGIWSFAFKKA